MAELNVTRRDDDTIPGAGLTAGGTAGTGERVVDTNHLLPEHTHAATPGTIAQVDDPEIARMQIEQTRARMSETIDQIEGALLRKKEEVQERMDVLSPVRRKARENPLPIIGGVFAAGLILGLLTGGDDDDDDDDAKAEGNPAVRRYAVDFDREQAHGRHWEERALTWERRARRLMDLANRQEAELLEMRGESVPVRGRKRRLFGRGRNVQRHDLHEDYTTGDVDVALHVEDRGYDVPRGGTYDYTSAPRTTGYDGMPLHEADSYPPRDEDLGYGYGRDPLPSPI